MEMALAPFSHKMQHPSSLCSALPLSFSKGIWCSPTIELVQTSPARTSVHIPEVNCRVAHLFFSHEEGILRGAQRRSSHEIESRTSEARTSLLFLTDRRATFYSKHNSELLENSSTILPEPTVSRRKALQTVFAFCTSTEILASQKSKALAEENLLITRKVFFDIAIDGEPVGEVVVGLYGEDVPIGAQRFADLAVGQRGIGYRRKEFGKVTPTYIQNNGVRSFSLSGGVKDAAKITGGESNETLLAEMSELDKKGTRPKNVTGAVSLFVVDPNKPPPKPKLIAKNGKFVYLEEESRRDPNATEFMIVTADSPQLDSSNLVVGRVVEGYDVIKKIAEVKVVNENSSSPYFQTAKLIGDSRAVVAERGFYRPYSKIVITRSGELR